ncbi:MAG TPA: hypothetical protein VFQ54_02510 [Thermomicrobiales bacterium]|nr:hypothetical protein [Thermomicrobiales bacterium]
MQNRPSPTYDERLVDRVIAYLQTRDPRIFPFTAAFDEERERAFIRDLRDGLADLSDSGSKRGTSSTGFLMNDWRLIQIVEEWAQARGGWPQGTDPAEPITRLAAFDPPKSEEMDQVPFAAGE